MEIAFSHELVSVIKRACFARHGNALRPTLLVVGAGEHDTLLTAVLKELALDSTLSTLTITAHDNASHENAAHGNAARDEVVLQRFLLRATMVLIVSELPRRSRELVALSQKPLLEWNVVKRDACPLFWPAHSVMDFFIVHQNSSVASPKRTISQEGEEQ